MTMGDGIPEGVLAYDGLSGVDAAVVPVGTMEAQVIKDLARMGHLDTGVRGSLAQLALVLARRLDLASGDPDTPHLHIAQLADRLRITLTSITEVNSDGDLIRRFFEEMRTPVRDSADP